MQRLRHPIRSITEPYGKAGLLVAILALVLATTGAAFAAVGLNSKQKKEVTAIAKKFAGKPGANGTSGTNGTNGAAGEKGPKGDNGASIVVVNTSPAKCPAGGLTVEVQGSGEEHEICNGNPAEFPETLPSGRTETGVWATGSQSNAMKESGIGGEFETFETEVEGVKSSHTVVKNLTKNEKSNSELATASISFPIPLKTAPTTTLYGWFGAYAIVIENGKAALDEPNSGGFTEAHEIWTEDCPGTLEAPKAKAGFLCVYGGEGEPPQNVPSEQQVLFEAARPFGINVPFKIGWDRVHFRAAGTWAVTAE